MASNYMIRAMGAGLGEFDDEIENATGLDFLSKLPDDIEDRIEREKAARLW